MSNDKLAEALRSLRLKFTSGNDVPVPEARITRAEWEAIEQAHAAEAAQAQAQSGEWVQKVIVDAKGDIEYVHVRIFNAMKARAEEAEAMFAAAPQQAAEPVGYVSADILKTFGKGDLSSIRLWRSSDDFGGPVVEVYTHPQPAQDAALYQELLMAVSKKFPNESRHETALRYIKQTELQSCEPKCDAAMAKESGR